MLKSLSILEKMRRDDTNVFASIPVSNIDDVKFNLNITALKNEVGEMRKRSSIT